MGGFAVTMPWNQPGPPAGGGGYLPLERTSAVTEGDPRHTLRRRTRTYLALAVAGALLVAALTSIGLPYVVMRAGPVTNILGTTDESGTAKPVLAIEGATTYPTEGELDFTTVLIVGGPGHSATAVDLLVAWLSPSQEVLPEDQVFPPGQTQEEADKEGAAEMASSQEIAAAVALRALGKEVKERVTISEVPDDSPNAGVLQAGDEILSVAGTPVASDAALRAELARQAPEVPFQVGIRRSGGERTVTIKTIERGERRVIGVYLAIDYELPVKVTINAGGVGGPSAGLMFGLAINDVLTPGAATGGQVVAGTGTLDPDGAVGPIGGIRQKMVGARDDGAQWFLAPADNCAEVVDHVPDGLRVVKVGTYAEGVAALSAIGSGGGDSLATCAAG